MCGNYTHKGQGRNMALSSQNVHVCVFVCFNWCSKSLWPDPERLSEPLYTLQKRIWLQLVLEKLLIHPNRHTCPFPVSVYYTAMILLWRLPLQWNTICFWFSPISFSHHSRHAFTKPKALGKRRFCFFSPLDMSPNISNRWGFKLIYSHNKRAQHFNGIVSNFKLIQ